MRAVLTTGHGDRGMLQVVEDYKTPEAKLGEVIIKIAATAVNFHDIFTRRGMPGIRIPLPLITGSDIAGTVCELGEGVADFQLGDRVLIDPVFRGSRIGMLGETFDGGRAEYVAAPTNQLVAIPDDVCFDDAASLPLAYGTAHRMMLTRGKVSAGETVMILGASGGVGVACVQLAKLQGAVVIACGSSATKLSRLKAIGADHIVDYSTMPLVEAVKAISGKPRMTGDGGVDVAVNFTGGSTWVDTQRCVKHAGRILTCGATAGFAVETDLRYLWTFEHNYVGANGWTRDDLSTLLMLVANGRLKPAIDTSLPLEQAAEAERMLEDREVVGKVLLKP